MGKMNINRVNDAIPINVERQNDVKATAKDTPHHAHHKKVSTEDKLDLSSRASEVGSLVDRLKQIPDVRDDKVNSLREQISTGSYKPAANDIADAILKDEA